MEAPSIWTKPFAAGYGRFAGDRDARKRQFRDAWSRCAGPNGCVWDDREFGSGSWARRAGATLIFGSVSSLGRITHRRAALRSLSDRSLRELGAVTPFSAEAFV